MKTTEIPIVLIVADTSEKALERTLEWYAEDREGRRIIRTRDDLHRALRTGMRPGIATTTPILETRKSNLAATVPNPVEVISVA